MLNKKLFVILSITGFLVSGCSQKKGDPTTITPPGGDDITEPTDFDESLWDMSQDSLREGTKHFDFYNFNDFHGAVAYDSDNSEPGINKLSTYIKNKFKDNPNRSILTSSGDMWQGSADSNITRGRLVTDWMNLLKFDAMCIGNHEFDWTIDTIKSNMERMNFPMLASNIYYEETNQPVEWINPYTTLTKDGLRIGVIGAIGEGETADILASNVKGITFVDPTESVSRYSKELRKKGADVILYLLHDSILDDDGRVKIKDEVINNVDLIFGGHTHQGENESLGNRNVPAIQAWCNGKDVGHITLNYDFNNDAVTNTYKEILDTRAYTLRSVGNDQETKAMYDEYLSNEITSITSRQVGYAPSGISKYDIPQLYNRYAYNYFCDNKEHDDIEIFAVETNNARSSIGAGVVTYGDVYKSLPFDNFLCLVKMTYRDISRYLGSYNSAHFYLPSSGATTDGSGIRDLCPSTYEYGYLLMIDYIAISEGYQNTSLEIVEYYTEEEALPRNIFSTYLSTDYPLNSL